MFTLLASIYVCMAWKYIGSHGLASHSATRRGRPIFATVVNKLEVLLICVGVVHLPKSSLFVERVQN